MHGCLIPQSHLLYHFTDGIEAKVPLYLNLQPMPQDKALTTHIGSKASQIQLISTIGAEVLLPCHKGHLIRAPPTLHLTVPWNRNRGHVARLKTAHR